MCTRLEKTNKLKTFAHSGAMKEFYEYHCALLRPNMSNLFHACKRKSQAMCADSVGFVPRMKKSYKKVDHTYTHSVSTRN